jgi:hypothetical protein
MCWFFSICYSQLELLTMTTNDDHKVQSALDPRISASAATVNSSLKRKFDEFHVHNSERGTRLRTDQFESG